MRGGASRVCLVVTVAILLTLLYPALFLDCRLAPEASLKSAPPWRELLGPFPKPSAAALEPATRLGPRLASIARNPLGGALWNPWIGGGRAGWLAGPEEGGTPLVVLAAALARPGWAWTALLALEIAAALIGTWWVLRLLGLGAWPAAVGATAYALSGAVTAHWLDWRGSALALGPLALVPVLAPIRGRRALIVAWSLALGIASASGSPAVAFVALAAAALVCLPKEGAARPRWIALAAAVVLVAAASLPRIWLGINGREPGAPVAAPRVMPPVDRWQSLVVDAGAASQSSPGGLAYLGLGTLMLAVVGAASVPARARGFWIGVAGVSAVLVAAPSGLLTGLGLWQRPYGILALTVAVLAAHGTQRLTARATTDRIRTTIGVTAWLLIAVSVVPRGSAHLPFFSAEESELATPIPRALVTTEWRLVGLLGAMPPDAAASLGLADVRASSLPGEPRYAAMLGAGRDGELTLARALDPGIVRLGARWLLEPLPLRVVSGEIFSRTEPAVLRRMPATDVRDPARFRADIPAGACRLGLPSSLGRSMRARLQWAGRSDELAPDETLQSETSAWTWFALPPNLSAGPGTLTISNATIPSARELSAAWDTSGLRVARQKGGMRVWEWTTARPLVFLARGIAREGAPLPPDPLTVTVPAERIEDLLPRVGGRGGGTVTITGVRPIRLEAAADLAGPALLVIQMKYRPDLFRVTVDGTPVRPVRVDGVWTGVPLPGGRPRVVVAARLPALIGGAAAAAVALVCILAVSRRRG